MLSAEILNAYPQKYPECEKVQVYFFENTFILYCPYF